MSTTVLKLIPAIPEFIPDKLNQTKAQLYLKNIFKKSIIEFTVKDQVEFVDQGINFESVSCNYCKQFIDADFWQNSMNEAFKGNFKTLKFTTPCCNKVNDLNDLKYLWPAGFAKFSIVVLDPPEDILESKIFDLEKILGAKITKIWAHY